MTYTLQKPPRMSSSPDIRARVIEAFGLLFDRVKERLRDQPPGLFARLAQVAPPVLVEFNAAEENVDRIAFDHVEGRASADELARALARYEAAWLSAAAATDVRVRAADGRGCDGCGLGDQTVQLTDDEGRIRCRRCWRHWQENE